MHRATRRNHRGGALAAVLTAVLWSGSARAQDEVCLSCHELDAAEDGVAVDIAAWQASVHAELGLGCADCHVGTDDVPHTDGIPPARCADCHEDAAEDFAASVHAEPPPPATPWPPGDPCLACHGVHDVRAVDDPASRVHHRNLARTCGGCHGELAIVQAYGLSTAPFDDYLESVHGRSKGSERRPADCGDCHRAHRVLRASHPDSRINPFRLAETCGACHAEVAEHYGGSVHGVAFAHGVSASPTCTDCHGIHTIKMVPEGNATPLEERLVRTTCVACHASEALLGGYGIAPARVRSYQASYHGLALQRGTTAVADCASCHGIHAIYPSSDAHSSVAPENLEATCGSCHPGAGEEFVKNPVHFVAAGEATVDVVLATWVRRFYLVLIAAVLGGILLHNGVIVGYHVRRKLLRERRQASRRRFSRSQVLQHAVLLVSFSVLAVTGFVLAYPDVWASRLLEGLGLSEVLRRWLHRGAAVVLLAAAGYHLAWLRTAPGRAELRHILPRGSDLRELLENLRFHLGRSDRPTAPGKYDYPAKIEYWSMVWGTAVMGATGLILWFPVSATMLLPFWTIKVSEVVHLLEAWLATLAILFFHFFYVFGHPEVYPVSLAMFTGNMSEQEARHHHPSWRAETSPREEQETERTA